MNRLVRNFVLPCVGFALLGLFTQSSDPAETFHDYLGFSLLPGANSTPVTYHIVRVYDDPARPLTANNISEGEFLNIAVGWGESSANPKNENLFDKYDVENCGYHADTIIHGMIVKGGLSCNPLKDLWRLEFKEYPFYNTPPKQLSKPGDQVQAPAGPGPGWAKEMNHPSDGQEIFLQQYGIQKYDDPIYGENAFKLLHDMQDQNWVSRYQGA